MRHRFQYIFHKGEGGNRESLYDISLPVKEGQTQRYFGESFKNALKFCCLTTKEFMNVINFKFLFLTFPAEAPNLCREIQLNSLRGFRNMSCCGSTESISYLQIVLHHTFGISLKYYCWHPWPNTRNMADGIGQCFLPGSSTLTTWVAVAGGLPIGLGTRRSCSACATNSSLGSTENPFAKFSSSTSKCDGW